MGLNYQIENDVFHITGGGKWDFRQMKELLQEVADVRAGNPLKGVLFDDRNSKFDARQYDFDDMARFRKSISDTISRRMAVVVSDDLHFALGRLSSVVHEGHGIEIEVSRDIEEARKWLTFEGTV
ncbi:MAG: hypothetical protein K9K88_05030 [Desulfobacterales bacterium]|nr:hypothetical protein [Desulfobacterales bacterium]